MKQRYPVGNRSWAQLSAVNLKANRGYAGDSDLLVRLCGSSRLKNADMVGKSSKSCRLRAISSMFSLVDKGFRATGSDRWRGCSAVHKWFLPTLSEVLTLADSSDRTGSFATLTAPDVAENDSDARRRAPSQTERQRLKAEREWYGAIAALRFLLQEPIGQEANEPYFSPFKGLVLSGPMPMLSHPALLANYAAWTFTAEGGRSPMPLLPPADWFFQPLAVSDESEAAVSPAPQTVPLLSSDPLTNEQFCVVLTARFSLAMVLGEDASANPVFQYSFDPEIVELAWRSLRARALLTNSGDRLNQLDALVAQFPPIAPDYKTVMNFSQLLLKYMPESVELETFRRKPSSHVLPAADSDREVPINEARSPQLLHDAFELSSRIKSNLNKEVIEQRLEKLTAAKNREASATIPAQDVELLQAIAHEVRTPLTTIRTLTRLLLKRQTLEPDVIKRLEAIDRECTEQIDRFNLIFRAVEMETSESGRSPVHLTSTSLAQIFKSCIPRWQKQASRRNLTLDVVLPQKMPSVVSDPTMLDQVLTGVIENFTSSLPAGGKVQVEVILAGHQLKVQLQCQAIDNNKSPSPVSTTLKSIGQLLMFQPETGNLSLNLSVTKNLFQALGGKLIVRQRPKQGEVLTIFLPLETNNAELFRSGSNPTYLI